MFVGEHATPTTLSPLKSAQFFGIVSISTLNFKVCRLMFDLNLLQDSKRFDKELGECQKFLSEVSNAALRRFILMGIPAKIEAQVSAFCLKGA